MDEQSKNGYFVRPMSVADLAQVLEWRNHRDIRRYMYTQHEISPIEHRRWFEDMSLDPNRNLLICQLGDTLVGFINFHVISAGKIADWGFYCAPGSPKGTGRMLGRAAIEHAFVQLQLHKICGQALAYNVPSIRLHQALGFHQEGVFRHHHFDGQIYNDVVHFGLLTDEWSPSN